MSHCLKMILLLSGSLAMTANAGTWKRFGKEQGLADDAVRALAWHQNRLYVGMLDGGMAILAGDRFETLGAIPGTPHVRQLKSDRAGNVWVATDEGAAQIRAGEVQWRPAGTPGLVSADVLSVFPTASGLTWLFPMDAKLGLSAWEANSGQISAYQVPESERLTPLLGTAIFADGQAVLVTENALYRAENGALTAIQLQGTAAYRPMPRGNNEESESRRLPPVYLTAAVQGASGTLWLVHPNVLLRYDGQKFQEAFQPTQGRLGPWVLEMQDGTPVTLSFQGTVYLGTSGQTVDLGLASSDMVDDAYLTPDGTLLVATQSALYRVRGMQSEKLADLRGEGQPINVHDLLLEAPNRLWLASDNGLYQWTIP